MKPDNVLLSIPMPAADPRFARVLDLSGWPTLPSPRLPGGTATSETGAAALLASAGLAVKVCDFNSAACCTGAGDFTVYGGGGTPQFTAPECLMGMSRGVDGKHLDTWAAGCVLYTMLFGRCPFWAEENILIQFAIIGDELPMPGGIVSPAAEEILRALLQKDPAARLTLPAALQHAWLRS